MFEKLIQKNKIGMLIHIFLQKRKACILKAIPEEQCIMLLRKYSKYADEKEEKKFYE